MSDHPTTFHGEADPDSFDWSDRASIHLADDGQGVLDAMKALHRGSMAEMVAHFASLPAAEQHKFVIQKAGDRQYGPDEVVALAQRKDFPG